MPTTPNQTNRRVKNLRREKTLNWSTKTSRIPTKFKTNKPIKFLILFFCLYRDEENIFIVTFLSYYLLDLLKAALAFS
jgi:hypothetical protein